MINLRESKWENKNFNKGQELILLKKDNERSGIRQAVEPKKQENVDKTLRETVNDVQESGYFITEKQIKKGIQQEQLKNGIVKYQI